MIDAFVEPNVSSDINEKCFSLHTVFRSSIWNIVEKLYRHIKLNIN